MADTMQFDLVSPERRLASLPVSAVRLPGAEGEMTAMPGHAPVITTLRPGVLRIESPEGTSEFVVTGGFAELGGESMSVLAEKAVPLSEMTRAHLDELIEDARTAHEAAKAAPEVEQNLVDEAAKLLADMEALGDHMSL
ncbi:F0F1 ATP synthase subunit epsilon [Pseudodonghicola flavimaris]|uniref:ATP synthase epsilon chain n=1 Tax=Pseudodonghicola flavimaris TaxID=3050036 RepID=A0ABT7EYK3_9RHOB|nr:F0F1 ATP synthase subunit epsilon [Pseudodonghicola flavimaris]MDK3017432.1 F0F1 ATP synthase subunit epsilon [Pseudodonghicola flavimaris]